MQFLRVGIIASKLCYQRARVLVSSQEGIPGRTELSHMNKAKKVLDLLK